LLNHRESPLRNRIIAAIRKIPRGRVSTYGAIARAAGYPGAARQVAQALWGAVDLPWHRVLGAGGEIKLTGDSAFEQRFRLQAEGVTFRGRRVDMKQHEYKFGKVKASPSPGKARAVNADSVRRPSPCD
jgi:methylated-DNA-protein-cysteine methyltransferase related protein